jgi:hypothetical protein
VHSFQPNGALSLIATSERAQWGGISHRSCGEEKSGGAEQWSVFRERASSAQVQRSSQGQRSCSGCLPWVNIVHEEGSSMGVQSRHAGWPCTRVSVCKNDYHAAPLRPRRRQREGRDRLSVMRMAEVRTCATVACSARESRNGRCWECGDCDKPVRETRGRHSRTT